MSITTNAHEIKFRNKFASKLPEELTETVTEAIRQVNSLSPQKALDTLWSLTCNPEETLQRLGMTTDKALSEGEDSLLRLPKLIPEELIIPLRNELRYQRTCVDKSFGKITVSDSLKDAFDAFYDAISQDDITALAVLNNCQKFVHHFDDRAMNRCIALLSSNKENFVFGGLRTIMFDFNEANYLLPFAEAIKHLLNTMYEDHLQERRGNSPFACLASMLDGMNAEEETEQPSDIPFEENVVATDSSDVPSEENAVETAEIPCTTEEETATEEGPTKEDISKQTVSALNIAANAKLFGDFLNAYNRLKDANFDPEEVISKMDAISSILESFKALG